MEIAIISNNDFGIESEFQEFRHSIKRYFCSHINDLNEDIKHGYSPDAIFLMDNGKIPTNAWHKEKFNGATLVLFTRDGNEIKDRDIKHALSSDIVFTQNFSWINFLAAKGINVFRFPHWVDQNIYFPRKEKSEIKYTDSIQKKGVNGEEFIPSVRYESITEADDRKYDVICSIKKWENFSQGRP